MRKFFAFLAVVSCGTICQAHKYEPINTEYALPVEIFILDITPQFLDLNEQGNFYLIPEIGIEMPLTSWSQIEVSIPYLLLDSPGSDSRNRFGDLELGFRALLPHPKSGPILTLNFEVLTPTGLGVFRGV